MQWSIIQTSKEWSMTQATTDMNLENTILRERNQTQKATYCVPAFPSSVQNRKIYGDSRWAGQELGRKGASGSYQVWGRFWGNDWFWKGPQWWSHSCVTRNPSLGRPTTAQETKKPSVRRTHSPKEHQLRQTSAHTCIPCSSSLENWSSPNLSSGNRKWTRNIVLNFLVATLKKLKETCKI